MTTQPDHWHELAKPFDAADIKQRPGRGNMTFSYVDARAVMQRLDDVMTPGGWDFTSAVIPGTDIVKGTLTVGGVVREDYGYPNSENDDEPIKAASSDALKRCAVMFGIGRHLYDDNRSGQRTASTGRAASSSARPAARTSTDVPNEEDIDFDSLPRTRPQVVVDNSDNSECPIHGVTWAGQWGDLWHKDPEGKYCRHPDNVQRGARR